LTARYQISLLIARSYRRPAFFFQHVLRTPLRKWQLKVCADISEQLMGGNAHPRAVIRTCHGAGKTFMAAGLGLWWIATRPESRGLTTAPTWAGVENLLWPEINKLYNGSLLKDLGFARLLNTKLEATASWYLIGGASDRPENLEGHHSPVASIRIVDEAKAVPDDVIVSTSGMLDAPETFDLWISTPSIASGSFYERDTAGGEDIIRAVVTIDDLIAEGLPGKAAKKAEWLREWGLDSPEYQSRALANYIDDAEGALFPYSWIERAMAQQWDGDGPVVAGFDVAGSKDGDESVVAVAAGPDLHDCYTVTSLVGWRERDTMLSKGRAIKAAAGAMLRVDSIGIGKGVHDAIRESGRVTQEYRASDRARDDTRFLNRKAEDCWRVRGLLEKGMLKLPDDHELKRQMAAMRFEITSAGKIRVRDPDDSPDRLDAVVIALSGGPVGDFELLTEPAMGAGRAMGAF